jgi:multidrug efflux system membrane fusion protein
VKIRVDNPDPELFRVGTSAVAVLGPGRGHDGERQ